jgi:putative endonuclease
VAFYDVQAGMVDTSHNCRHIRILAGPRDKVLVKYHVYILECADKSLYTGITKDLHRRFKEHRAGRGGHFTASRKAVKIKYSEVRKDRSSALKRESEIKSWPRKKKLSLISKAVI